MIRKTCARRRRKWTCYCFQSILGRPLGRSVTSSHKCNAVFCFRVCLPKGGVALGAGANRLQLGFHLRLVYQSGTIKVAIIGHSCAFVAGEYPFLMSDRNPRSFDFAGASEYDYKEQQLTTNRLRTERHKGGPGYEIQMCTVLVPGLCGTKPEFTTGQDLAMAHRVVSRLEGLSERVG